MNTVICSTQEATHRDFALEQSVHNEEEIVIQPFLLELFAEVAQDGHRWNHRRYGLQVMSQDPRTDAGLSVTEHHHKESIQRLEMERFTYKSRLHIPVHLACMYTIFELSLDAHSNIVYTCIYMYMHTSWVRHLLWYARTLQNLAVL